MQSSIRFKVFQRDGFICQYCGEKPPKAILEVDHIIPKSKNGKDNFDNLITACFECNSGKSNKDLKDIPKTIEKNIEEIKERKKQLKEFYKYQEEIENRNSKILFEISCYWEELWDGKYSLNIRGEANVKMFLKNFDKEEIKEGMAIARGKNLNDIERSWKYFCGVMWNKLRNKNEDYENKK